MRCESGIRVALSPLRESAWGKDPRVKPEDDGAPTAQFA